MKVGVLGTGVVGHALGSKLVALGHDVVMGSRDAGNEKAVAWAATAGGTAGEGTFSTAAAFGDMGVPAPAAAALFAAVVEFVGGLLLIAGLLTPVAAVLNALNLLGAFVIVHAGNGVFVENGGYELVLALIAGLLLIGTLGAGRYSADELLTRRLQHA